MDNREKFNIKQMVDCERQEPFYPVTHAQAIQVIDEEGKLKNLQDIIGFLLNFINTWGNIEITDLISLGYEHNQAFFGDEGKILQDTLLPISTSVNSGDDHPVSGDAVYNYVINQLSQFEPNGVISDSDPLKDNAVSGSTVFEYLWEEFLGGSIEDSDETPPTCKQVHDYVESALDGITPNGIIEENNEGLVSGGTVWTALQDLENTSNITNIVNQSIEEVSLWEKDPTYLNSIKQKNNYGLEVTKQNEIAIGKYNKSTNNTIFSIGAGSSSSKVNAVEVKSDLTNSLVIPFDSSTISIQGHMRNEQSDIKHITAYQLDKLEQLIIAKWHGDAAITNNVSGRFYTNHENITLTVKVWPDVNEPNTYDTFNNEGSKIQIKQGNTVLFEYDSSNVNNNANISVGVPNSSYSEIENDRDGKFSLTFKLNGKTDNYTIPDSGISTTATIYAPVYAFSSTSNNESAIPAINPIGFFTQLKDFNITVTISSDGNTNKYLYIAIPKFLDSNNTLDTQTNNPFVNGPLPFSLDSTYGKQTVQKSILVKGYNATTDYYMFRSALKLNPGSEWKITTNLNQ